MSSGILLLLLLLLLYFSFLFTSPLSPCARTGPLCLQARCRKRRLNLGYSLSQFILSCIIFVFYDLYFVDLVVPYLVLC